MYQLKLVQLTFYRLFVQTIRFKVRALSKETKNKNPTPFPFKKNPETVLAQTNVSGLRVTFFDKASAID